MRKIWLLVGALGCSDAPSDAKPTKAAAAQPASKASPAPTSGGKKKASKRTKKAKRSSGNVPHTVQNGLSKSDRDNRMIARCSDGNIVFDFWQGEYPSPVVQLDQPLRTTVRTDPCGGTVEKGCTAPAGLYHPWAQEKHQPGPLEFAVRTMPETWRLAKPFSIAGTQHKAGTTVEVLTYLSEGYCTMSIGGLAVEDMCPGTTDDTVWKRVSPERSVGVQLVKVPCAGGSSGWLTVDEAFMKQPGVREGEMQSYGEVAPAR